MSRPLVPAPLTPIEMQNLIYKRLRVLVPEINFLDDKFVNTSKKVGDALDSIAAKTALPKLEGPLNSQLQQLKQIHLNKHWVIGRGKNKEANTAFNNAFNQLVHDLKDRYKAREDFKIASSKFSTADDVVKSSIEELLKDAGLETSKPNSISVGARTRIMLNYLKNPAAFERSFDGSSFGEFLSQYDGEMATNMERLSAYIMPSVASESDTTIGQRKDRIKYILSTMMLLGDGVSLDKEANNIIDNILAVNIGAGILTEDQVLKMLDGVDGKLTTRGLEDLFASKQQFYDYKRKNKLSLDEVFTAKDKLLEAIETDALDLSEEEKEFAKLVISCKNISIADSRPSRLGEYDLMRVFSSLYDGAIDLDKDIDGKTLGTLLANVSGLDFAVCKTFIKAIKDGTVITNTDGMGADSVSMCAKLNTITDPEKKKYLTIFTLVAISQLSSNELNDHLEYLVKALEKDNIKISDLITAIKDDNVKEFLEEQEKESEKWSWRRKKSKSDDKALTNLKAAVAIPPQDRPSTGKIKKEKEELQRQYLSGDKFKIKRSLSETSPTDLLLAKSILSGGARPPKEDKFLREFVRTFKSKNLDDKVVRLVDYTDVNEIKDNLENNRWSIIPIPTREGSKPSYIMISPNNDIIAVRTKGDDNFYENSILKYVSESLFASDIKMKVHPVIKLKSEKQGYDQIRRHCNSLSNVLDGITSAQAGIVQAQTDIDAKPKWSDKKKESAKRSLNNKAVKAIKKAADKGSKGYDDVKGHLTKQAYEADLKSKFLSEFGATFAALIKENPELKDLLEITPLNSVAIAENVNSKVWSLIPNHILGNDPSYIIVSPAGKALYIQTGGVTRAAFDRVFEDAMEMTLNPRIKYKESDTSNIRLKLIKDVESQNARFCNSLASFVREFAEEVKKKDKSSTGLPVVSSNSAALTLGNKKLILSLVDSKGVVNPVALKALKSAVAEMGTEFSAAPKVLSLLSEIALDKTSPSERRRKSLEIVTHCSPYIAMGVVSRTRYDFPISKFKTAASKGGKDYEEKDFMPSFSTKTDLFQDEDLSEVVTDHLFPNEAQLQITGLKKQIESLALAAAEKKKIKVPKSFGFIPREVLVTQNKKGIKLEYTTMESNGLRATNTSHIFQIQEDGKIFKDGILVTSVKAHREVTDFLMNIVGKKFKEDDKESRLEGRRSYEEAAIKDLVEMSSSIGAFTGSDRELGGVIFPSITAGKPGLKINIGDLEINAYGTKETTYKKAKGNNEERLKFILECRAKYQEVLRLQVVKKLAALEKLGFFRDGYTLEKEGTEITAFSIVKDASRLSALDDANPSLFITQAKKLDKCIKTVGVFNSLRGRDHSFADGQVISIKKAGSINPPRELIGEYQIFKNGIFKVSSSGNMTEVQGEEIDKLKAQIEKYPNTYAFYTRAAAPVPARAEASTPIASAAEPSAALRDGAGAAPSVPALPLASIASPSLLASGAAPSAAVGAASIIPSLPASDVPASLPVSLPSASSISGAAVPGPSLSPAVPGPASISPLDAIRSRAAFPVEVPSEPAPIRKKVIKKQETPEQIKNRIIANIVSYLNDSKNGSREEIAGNMFNGWPDTDKDEKGLPILKAADFPGNHLIENTRYLRIAGVHLIGFEFNNNFGLNLRGCVLENCIVNNKNTSIAKGGHGKVDYILTGDSVYPNPNTTPVRVCQLMTTEQQQAHTTGAAAV